FSISQTSLESKLEALQCHFTWDLDLSRSKLFRLRSQLEDIGTEEGNSWLGHIYNLRGYVQYKLGFTEDAQSLFNKAAEAFCQTRRADEGPWLVVNYGNQAWLHHHLGEQAESQAYLSKVDALMNEYPSPSQNKRHPEIYAEKAWTLMKFGADKKLLAANYFQRAIKMQPDMVEWFTSRVFAKAAVRANTGLDAEMLEEMRIAKEQDPENLYLAAHYLRQNAETMEKEKVAEEARELAQKILMNPVSSYSGLKPLLWVYRNYVSVDEAVDLAEEALKHHPDVRFLKSCVALCYKSKIYCVRDGPPDQSMIDRAISLLEELISIYPEPSLMRKIDLANIYAKSNHSQAKAEQIYQELLESDLDPADKQMVYNKYAKYLHFVLNDSCRSAQCHMRAAEILIQSHFRRDSVTNLEKIRDRNWHQMRREVEEFLEKLPEPQ
ncbi:interferon-induced protein with tetratricopeptide repeats 1B-like, partial [Pagrus major]|uniref:interferon-induced protein with tetratricopeptide repeats 1B-like n=1 Tax=Pagrus major TaxID=143350 RepID=UPI003CC84E4F